MHLLILLNLADKILEVSHINEVIYAKLSIVEANPTSELTKIIILVILYSLCKEINFHSPCMSNI